MYKKQEWKDEIPDLSKPVLDSSGKQKVDPQTGRPLWELVQEGTRITSSRLNHMEDGIQAAHDSIENITQSLTPESIGAAKKSDFDVFQKNSVSIKTSNNKDFNTYREPGLYFVGSIQEYKNAPSSDGGFSWGILRVETLGTTAYVVQSYTCVLNNVTFTRSKAEDQTGREWQPWRETTKLDTDGVLRLNKWVDIRGDAATLNSIGTTHAYHAFIVGQERSGYVGSSDPNAPGNMALVSDKADVLINAKTNIWMNAYGGAVHLNGRNILWELDQVKQSGVNNKQALVDALNAKGVAASINEDWGALIWKIRGNIPSLAKITTNASTGTAYFREATTTGVGRPEYCVTVTGLNFRAKYIMVHWWGGIQSPQFQAGYAAERGAKIFTESSFNTAINLVQGDTLPDPWRGYTIDATVTSNGFVIPVGNSSSLSGRELEIVAIG